MKIFNRKKELKGHYCLVIWSDMAAEYSVGYDFLKKIYYYFNGRLYKINNYTEMRINEARRRGLSVLDLTAGENIPAESMFVPGTYTALGVMEIVGRSIR